MVGLQREVVEVRLLRIKQLISFLDKHRHLTASDLEEDDMSRFGIERVIALIVEAAVDVNRHIVKNISELSPHDSAETFDHMYKVGILSKEQAKELACSVGMRNVLVHEYLDVDVVEVAAAIPLAIRQYGEYGRAVSEWLLRQGS